MADSNSSPARVLLRRQGGKGGEGKGVGEGFPSACQPDWINVNRECG